MNREEQEEAGLEHAPAERSEGRRVLETAGRSHFGLGKSWPLQGLEPASDAPARPEGVKEGGIANTSLIRSLRHHYRLPSSCRTQRRKGSP